MEARGCAPTVPVQKRAFRIPTKTARRSIFIGRGEGKPSWTIPIRSNYLYRARPQNQRSRIEVKRGAESLQEIYPKNPIDPQPGRKSDHEDVKRLDNNPFDLQALETKARHFSFHTLDTGYGTSRHRMAQIVP